VSDATVGGAPASSARDRAIWNALFGDVPPDWRTASPSRAMVDCRDFFVGAGARSVLDLGCGVGRWAVYLAKAGFEVSGSDFAENGLRYAAGWAADEGVSVRLVCRPITEMPFPGERFDAVVAALVLDNVTRGEMAFGIDVMRRSLRPDGVAFCLFNPLVTCDSAADGTDNPTAGVTRVVYDDAELRAAFAEFSVIDTREYEMRTRGLFLRRCGPA
jgi:ubiquinone/menaquinone biosynthesis C-methylase UbiE